MRLKVLVDNNTTVDRYYYGEPGVSYYIEDGDTRLLFDVGYSDVFLRNSQALGIKLNDLNAIIISHGHDDHTGGLKYYFAQEEYNRDISIVAHPDALNEKSVGGLKICSPVSQTVLEERCHLILSKDPVKVSQNITFLGEIPQKNDFEIRKPIGKQIVGMISEDDYLRDDSALAYKTASGIYLITGCSHSGVCNIIEYAKEVCAEERVLGIIGGFHLFEVTEQVYKTIDYLKRQQLKELYPCHCTSFSVKAEIHKAAPVKEVGVGMEIDWC